MSGEAKAMDQPGDGAIIHDRNSVSAIVGRAQKGDKSCLPQLRELFRDPKHAPLLNAFGSPPEWLESALVGTVSGKDLAIKEATARKLAEVRRELEGPNPTPIERLLAERAAICWWLVNRYEHIYATGDGLSIRQADFAQKRIDRAHGRFLAAVKTLATVRKLAVPALQVNIGTNQVNSVQTAES